MDETPKEDYFDGLEDEVQCSIEDYNENIDKYDLDAIVFKIDSQIDFLSSHADNLDYLVAIASGLVCSILDILWCSDLDLTKARDIGSEKAEGVVKKCAKLLGCKDSDDLASSVKFLEEKFKIPSDGNTPKFGGGLQHHLRDFAHHPTIIGLIFSLLTQFTELSYGTDTNGNFIIEPVPEGSKVFIGDTVPQKLIMGTIIWFFHLISDMAGSSNTAGKTGGTGIPGPILSLAKELSALPFFKKIQVNDGTLSLFLSKLFNGTLLADHDENGKIIPGTELRFDLRAELGLGMELAQQSIPVAANECFVRVFFFVRRLGEQMSENNVRSLDDFKHINWKKVFPTKNPTISRMLLVATGVFTTLDISEAVIEKHSQFYVAVNYIGVGRFLVAIGQDVCWGLKTRDLKRIRDMYYQIIRNVYRENGYNDSESFEFNRNLIAQGFGLTEEEVEILYNMEYHKTLHNVQETNQGNIRTLKQEWLDEWQQFITEGFPSFIQNKDATMHWYSKTGLLQRISELEPTKPWYRLVLLEATLFEPYFTISPVEDEAVNRENKKQSGKKPNKKYDKLQTGVNGFNKKEGDQYLNAVFTGEYCESGYINRLRKGFSKSESELREDLKNAVIKLSGIAVLTFAAAVSAGALAPSIAVMLVGSRFAGLAGAALTSACLAYLGGGAIAVGGAGMAGGTIAIVGGGSILGFLGGGAVGAFQFAENAEEYNANNTIYQSAKLLVAVNEVFLNDEHDSDYANTVYNLYLSNIERIEHNLVKLKLDADIEKGETKKKITTQINQAEKTVNIMKIARKSMLKSINKFNEINQEDINQEE